jgi:dimethylhistidine N-methyltransferase
MAEYAFFDHHPPQTDILDEVLDGLRCEQKTLSPKFFYDEDGSRLFEAITRLPEYYLTRTELAIFDAHGSDMRTRLDHRDCIIEYGSGSNLKIRRLLELARPRAYVPVDISKEHLAENARELHEAYPQISVYPVCADFSQPIPLPPQVRSMEKTAFFPGSSIGNFEPPAAVDFLRNVARTVGPGGQLLIGVDCAKSADVLEPAYDDAAGVTAEFNRNMLVHLNERLQADFDVDAYAHQAVYNTEAARIEMYLVARSEQRVRIGGEVIHIAAGERIHTEHSYKYAPDAFVALAEQAGFSCAEVWQDERNWFAIYLLEA